MRILVLTSSAWRDTNSTGNTFSNWFENWKDATFYNIYARNEYPDNKCCSKYLRISPSDILRNLITPWRIGKTFSDSPENETENESIEAYAKNSKFSWLKETLRTLVDIAYSTEFWLNKRTKSFILDFNPDIVFMSAQVDTFKYPLVKFIKRKTSARLITFSADDIYGMICSEKLSIRLLHKARFEKLIAMSDLCYGASTLLCDNYSRLFGKTFIPLYKGCNISNARKTINSPIRIIYAGNLHWGRDITLQKLVSVLSDLNKDGTKAFLSIYSNSFVSEQTRTNLNVDGTSAICKAIPYTEITEKMRQSDIVLHVESFDKRQIAIVRYSFSTKIIDCLQSGSAMMVIGPSGIASVEYVRQIDKAIVIDDTEQIKNCLETLFQNPNELIGIADSINKYAIRNHLIDNVRTSLQNDFYSLLHSAE